MNCWPSSFSDAGEEGKSIARRDRSEAEEEELSYIIVLSAHKLEYRALLKEELQQSCNLHVSLHSAWKMLVY